MYTYVSKYKTCSPAYIEPLLSPQLPSDAHPHLENHIAPICYAKGENVLKTRVYAKREMFIKTRVIKSRDLEAVYLLKQHVVYNGKHNIIEY